MARSRRAFLARHAIGLVAILAVGALPAHAVSAPWCCTRPATAEAGTHCGNAHGRSGVAAPPCCRVSPATVLPAAKAAPAGPGPVERRLARDLLPNAMPLVATTAAAPIATRRLYLRLAILRR